MRHKEYTPEEALARLSELKTELEGEGSSLPVTFCRRYGLEVPQWARDCWAKKMREYRRSDERIRVNAKIRRVGRRDPERATKMKIEYYERNRDLCIARVYTRNWLVKRSLLRDGWECHHFNGSDWTSFIYLPREAHRLLHFTFGWKNETVGLREFYQMLKSNPEAIPEYLIIVNKRVVEAKGFTEEEIERCQE